jgi:glycerophosphoryl diester phosphodiesterase/dienelactone hydrolase
MNPQRLLPVVLVCAHWFVGPRAARTEQPGPARLPAVVGHRGLLRHAPENTLAAFDACLQRGLGFELDVRRAKDGALVCLHDDTVDRTTNGTGPVQLHTLAELKALDAGSWFGTAHRGARIPTLDQVLALAAKRGGSAPIAVDLKVPDVEADTVRLAKRHGVLDRLIFIGRAIDRLEVRRQLRDADPGAQVARLASGPAELDPAARDPSADWVYVRFVPAHQAVVQLHAAGRRVFLSGPAVAGLERATWRHGTLNGVDAILTDYAVELASLLQDDTRRAAEIRAKLEPFFTPPPDFQGNVGKFPSPLRFADGRPIRTAAEWPTRRAELLADWHRMLGPWPERIARPQIKTLATEHRENFTQQHVHVEIYPGGKFADGYLLVPDGPGPFPAVVVPFYEAETSIGRGKRGQGTHDYGLQLARRGFVTLSIATPGSIEHPQDDTRKLLSDAGESQDRQPLNTLAYVAANCHTALANLPNVDRDRIGIIGLSYGGKWTMFASCLHEPFACAVWSDPGIVFNESNANVNYWEPWYLGFERGVRRAPGVPNADRPRTGLYKRLVDAGRDLNELHPLICPRPVLVSGGTEDPPQNWQALNHLIAVNRLLGHSNRVAMTARKTHVPTPEALEIELLFLEYFLKYDRAVAGQSAQPLGLIR